MNVHIFVATGRFEDGVTKDCVSRKIAGLLKYFEPENSIQAKISMHILKMLAHQPWFVIVESPQNSNFYCIYAVSSTRGGQYRAQKCTKTIINTSLLRNFALFTHASRVKRLSEIPLQLIALESGKIIRRLRGQKYAKRWILSKKQEKKGSFNTNICFQPNPIKHRSSAFQ